MASPSGADTADRDTTGADEFDPGVASSAGVLAETPETMQLVSFEADAPSSSPPDEQHVRQGQDAVDAVDRAVAADLAAHLRISGEVPAAAAAAAAAAPATPSAPTGSLSPEESSSFARLREAAVRHEKLAAELAARLLDFFDAPDNSHTKARDQAKQAALALCAESTDLKSAQAAHAEQLRAAFQKLRDDATINPEAFRAAQQQQRQFLRYFYVAQTGEFERWDPRRDLRNRVVHGWNLFPFVRERLLYCDIPRVMEGLCKSGRLSKETIAFLQHDGEHPADRALLVSMVWQILQEIFFVEDEDNVGDTHSADTDSTVDRDLNFVRGWWERWMQFNWRSSDFKRHESFVASLESCGVGLRVSGLKSFASLFNVVKDELKHLTSLHTTIDGTVALIENEIKRSESPLRNSLLLPLVLPRAMVWARGSDTAPTTVPFEGHADVALLIDMLYHPQGTGPSAASPLFDPETVASVEKSRHPGPIKFCVLADEPVSCTLLDSTEFRELLRSVGVDQFDQLLAEKSPHKEAHQKWKRVRRVFVEGNPELVGPLVHAPETAPRVVTSAEQRRCGMHSIEGLASGGSGAGAGAGAVADDLLAGIPPAAEPAAERAGELGVRVGAAGAGVDVGAAGAGVVVRGRSRRGLDETEIKMKMSPARNGAAGG